MRPSRWRVACTIALLCAAFLGCDDAFGGGSPFRSLGKRGAVDGTPRPAAAR